MASSMKQLLNCIYEIIMYFRVYSWTSHSKQRQQVLASHKARERGSLGLNTEHLLTLFTFALA